jgi:hypothetical protein
MQTMLSKLDAVDMKVVGVRTGVGGKLDGIITQIEQFPEGALAQLETIFGKVESARANLDTKAGNVETRANGMMPPP